MSMILIGDYKLDASLSEDHAFESEITEYPLESGSMVADHVRIRPISVSIEFIVSDTPLGAALTYRAGVLDLDDTGVTEKISPSEDALFTLLQIWQAREPVTITTSLKTYDDMILESLTIPKAADTGFALRGTARFKQIQIITNKRVVIKTADPRGQGKKKLGSRPSQKSTPETTAWMCPRGIAVSDNANLNVANRCVLVIRMSDGKYKRLVGEPLTPTELTRWNETLNTQHIGDLDGPIIYNTDGTPVSRDATLSKLAVDGFEPVVGQGGPTSIPPPFKF